MYKGIIKEMSSRVASVIINTLFPRRCAVCGKIISNRNDDKYNKKNADKSRKKYSGNESTCQNSEREYTGENEDKSRLICSECEEGLLYIKEPTCKKCGRQLKDETKVYCDSCSMAQFSFDRGISVFIYGDLIRKSIHDFKYHNRRENAEFYGMAIMENCGKLINLWQPDALIPVPIHKKRYIKRGYNQSEVLAESITKYTGVRTVSDAVCRIKKTKPQKNLDKSERENNLRNAFAVKMSKLEGIKTVILIDDIYTTGSTIDSLARMLRAAGVQNIYFICLSTSVTI